MTLKLQKKKLEGCPMTQKIVDFIHVGDYKTGTSWLQETVFPYHPEIDYLGDHFANKHLNIAFRDLVDTRDLDFDAFRLRNDFRQNIKRRDKIIGVSREVLSQSNYITGEHAKRNAERLYEVFGNVKIVYVVREQFSMLASIYSQYLKMGGTRSFDDWFLDPVECRGIIERLKYDKNILMYQEIFGKENVLILLFEELQSEKELFLKKLYQFVGCEDSSFIPKESDRNVNSGLTSHGAFLSKILHRLVRNNYHNFKSSFLSVDKLIYKVVSAETKKRRDQFSKEYVLPNYKELDRKQRILFSINMGLMGKITSFCEKIKTGNKIKVPQQTQEMLKPYFIESNIKLQEQYGLNVKKFGWTLK